MKTIINSLEVPATPPSENDIWLSSAPILEKKYHYKRVLSFGSREEDLIFPELPILSNPQMNQTIDKKTRNVQYLKPRPSSRDDIFPASEEKFEISMITFASKNTVPSGHNTNEEVAMVDTVHPLRRARCARRNSLTAQTA